MIMLQCFVVFISDLGGGGVRPVTNQPPTFASLICIVSRSCFHVLTYSRRGKTISAYEVPIIIVPYRNPLKQLTLKITRIYKHHTFYTFKGYLAEVFV